MGLTPVKGGVLFRGRQGGDANRGNEPQKRDEQMTIETLTSGRTNGTVRIQWNRLEDSQSGSTSAAGNLMRSGQIDTLTVFRVLSTRITKAGHKIVTLDTTDGIKCVRVNSIIRILEAA